MDKYKKVMKPKETTVKNEEEIRVTAAGSVSAYVSRAAKLFNEMDKQFIVIAATGNALTKAVTSAEVIKRRFKGLHQITKVGSQEIIDEYEPIEEGLDKVEEKRNLPFIEIKLSKEALDSTDIGYQEPVPEDQVKEYDPEEMASRGRGRGGGGGGKGRGKKGDDSTEKDKGKGKGKREDSGKGKGKSSEPKGKGKGKGRDEGKGKSKGGSKGKGGGGGWWDDYAPPARSKGGGGKGKGGGGGGGGGWGNSWNYGGGGGGWGGGWGSGSWY